VDELRELAAQVGHDGQLEDEHARFAVYSAAIQDPAQWDLLLPAVAQEPDGNVASDILAKLLERVPRPERAAILRVAPADRTTFLVRRDADLGVLDDLASEESTDGAVVERVVEGSDWLQRRVVDRDGAVPGTVLEALAERGRTRKVRAAARERLRRAGDR
jgi:hypothetical protein